MTLLISFAFCVICVVSEEVVAQKEFEQRKQALKEILHDWTPAPGLDKDAEFLKLTQKFGLDEDNDVRKWDEQTWQKSIQRFQNEPDSPYISNELLTTVFQCSLYIS